MASNSVSLEYTDEPPWFYRRQVYLSQAMLPDSRLYVADKTRAVHPFNHKFTQFDFIGFSR